MIEVIERSPELCCLGITNAIMEQVLETEVTPTTLERGYIATKHIGGIGLFRRDMFSIARLRGCQKNTRGRGYSGIQNAQRDDKRTKGWYVPFIGAELLDRPSHHMWGRKDLLKKLNNIYGVQRYGRKNERELD